MRHSRSRSARRAVLGVTLVLATVAAGCSGGEGDGDGGDARSITVYSGRAASLVGPLLERFTEETGIEVEVRNGDSGELAAQIITEGDASQADVFFSQDAGALGALADAGLLDTLPAATLGAVPERFRATDDTWVGTSGRARVLVYDPAQVSELPAGIDDLLDPAWTAEIGYAPSNASWQSFVTALRVLRGEDGARTWLEGFAALEPKAYENNIAVRDAVDEGQIAMGLINHYYLFEKIATDGAANVSAKLHFFAGGDPGGLVNVAGVGILKSSDAEADAQRLVDFLLSAESQRYFADETFEYPVVEGVPANDAVPPLAELDPPTIDLADLRSIQTTQELLADVGLLTR